MKSDNKSSSGNTPEREDAAPSKRAEIPAECMAFERILASVADQLSNTTEHKFNDAMVNGLGEIAEFLGFDRSTIMMFSEHGKRLSVSHSWAAEGIPLPAGGCEIPQSWYLNQVRMGRIVRIPDGHPKSPTCGQVKIPHLNTQISR